MSYAAPDAWLAVRQVATFPGCGACARSAGSQCGAGVRFHSYRIGYSMRTFAGAHTCGRVRKPRGRAFEAYNAEIDDVEKQTLTPYCDSGRRVKVPACCHCLQAGNLIELEGGQGMVLERRLSNNNLMNLAAPNKL